MVGSLHDPQESGEGDLPVDGTVLKKIVNINRLKPHKRRVPSSPTKVPQEPVIISSGAECSDSEAAGNTAIANSDLDNIKRRWLNDKVIHAAQMLMKGYDDQLPVSGLQNPLLGQKLSFAVQGGEAVQILHSGGNHRVTTFTVGVAHPNIRVFDSLQTVASSSRHYKAANCCTSED